uniref:Chloride conductance regulatory protein ICln n=1 Tax=Ananas comosus var. bracteatus TaxID=296719 RepID=A0A6V7QKG5_ANACO|nr:unnamed protein product [Ananas comosus var. bracteatus]
MVVGLRPFDDRVGDGPRLDADSGEEVMRVERGVAVALGRRPMESPGTLFVTTKRVIWLSDVDKEKGTRWISCRFRSTRFRGIRRPIPCPIETGNDGNDVEGSDSEFGQDTDLSRITEMRLMLSDSNQLDALFDIFCQCAELNPDPNSVSGEENSWVFGNEEMGDGSYPERQPYESLANPIGYANGAHDLAHSVLELQINDLRFEDAEEVEHDTNGDHQ